MILNQTVEYCLRAMAVLADAKPGTILRTTDLAEATGIPGQYLSKIMRRLVLARLVSSRRGHGGGFALAREPKEIRLADVLEAAGLELELDRCAFGWGTCSPESPCSLHPVWTRLNQSIAEWAADHTLADLGAMRASRR